MYEFYGRNLFKVAKLPLEVRGTPLTIAVGDGSVVLCLFNSFKFLLKLL